MNTEKREERRGGAPVIGWGARPGAQAFFGAGAMKSGTLGLILAGTFAAVVGGYRLLDTGSSAEAASEAFQNNYFADEAARARDERAARKYAASAQPAVSSVDLFRDQMASEGMSSLPGGADGASGAGGSAAAHPEPGQADADGQGMAAAGEARLIAANPFKPSENSRVPGTTIPALRQQGGLSGGIGGKFRELSRPSASAGNRALSAMRPGQGARFNAGGGTGRGPGAKGAFGQAKYAAKMGVKAAYSGDASGSRTSATGAFSGETSGAGDVGTPAAGAGLGGAGISNGNALKYSDPSISHNEHSVPKPPKPEDVSPWKEYENMAMKFMLISVGLILLTKILGYFSKSCPPLYQAALATAYAAIAAALVVVFAGLMMFMKYGQKMMGAMYMLVGGVLVWQAWEALAGLEDPSVAAAQPAGVTQTGAANSLNMGTNNVAATTGGNVSGGVMSGGNITTAGGATNIGSAAGGVGGTGATGSVSTTTVNAGSVVKTPFFP